MEIFADNFTASFEKESELLGFLLNRDRNSSWCRRTANKLRFFPLEESCPEAKELEAEYDAAGKLAVIKDTIQNSQLLMQLDTGEKYPIRSCAIRTILDRARINGNALRKVSKRVLSRILDDCISVADGDALLNIKEDKVSALHGGDSSDYAVLPMADLIRLTVNYIAAKFQECKFRRGSYDHYLVSAVWSLGDQEELVASYLKALDAHQIPHGRITPLLRLSSSDVGICGANLYPSLQLESGQNLVLGYPLKLEHKGGATLEQFESQLGQLYSQYTKAIGGLDKLFQIRISNPVNCMAGVSKRIQIPKRLAFQAISRFQLEHGTYPCTAYEIYMGICHVLTIMKDDSEPGYRLAQMEENVSRALSLKWNDYDIPGELVW